jgi:hypothetical protein
MNQELNRLAFSELKQSHYWTPKTRVNESTIQNLVCPDCGDPTAWAHVNSPMSINCNKLSSCGARTKTLDLFNIRINIEKANVPTKTDPKKPARAYLESRGIINALKGLKYYYLPKARGGQSGAVMFSVGIDAKGKRVSNGRLINPSHEQGKTHNIGSTSGQFWQHQGIKYDLEKPTYVTEGIIDALSLIELELQAIAVLAAGQDPSKLDLSSFDNLVLAFDNDAAGAKATKKWIEHFPSAKAILPDKGIDWNHLLCSGLQDHVKSILYASLPRYATNARLAMAKSAREYADVYKEFYAKPPGLFFHSDCTYFSSFKTKGSDTTVLSVERIGKFCIEVLSYVNVGTENEKEYLYQLQVKPKGGRPVKCLATGESLSSAKGLKSFLLTHAKVSYEGTANATTALITQLANWNAPEVRQPQYIGFDPQSRWFIFPEYAIDTEGRQHRKDRSGLFKISHTSRLSPATQTDEKSITPSITPKATPKIIYELIHRAWGDNGALAFSWVLGSWFVNTIKEAIGFYPFLSFYGPPACGKTNLTERLQLLQGIDEEGLDLSSTSTTKGIARKIYGLSGMFSALLEFNEDNKKAMGFANLLSAYNRGGGMVQAKFSANLDTKETPLLCALLFSQNVEPWKNSQQKQRVISLHFTKENLTNQTKNALDELNLIPKTEMATVMQEFLKKRKVIEAGWVNEYQIACADLGLVKEERIRNNHALPLAFNRLFCKQFSIDSDIFQHVETTALVKEKTSAELEINDASLFFEMVHNSEAEQKKKYWHEIDRLSSNTNIDYNSLYFSLTELVRMLQSEGQQPPRALDLQKALKAHPAYLIHGINHRFPAPPRNNGQGPTSVQRKAWKLDLEKYREIENPPIPEP